MGKAKKLDILIGIRAEQSLRDALRKEVERSATTLELTPVGRKDWIAGQRVGQELTAGQLEETTHNVHKKLLALGAEQRIRFESLRLYAVPLPVPVFKDPEESVPQTDQPLSSSTSDEAIPTAPEASSATPPSCPVCGRTVHQYNLHYNTNGQVVGCFMCGGHKDQL